MDLLDINKYKLLLFDLDGTLLRDDKTISQQTLDVLEKYRENGFSLGISTSRSEQNTMKFIADISPDIIISSGGALVKYKGDYIFKAEFSIEETQKIIHFSKNICGDDCEITVDTITRHYWNYRIEPQKFDTSWGNSKYTDFNNFSEKALKICVEINNTKTAEQLSHILTECDCIRFSGTDWYKFTKKSITKENAIINMCDLCNISKEQIIAFGDDYADIGMLKICGMGVAMGNAEKDVKAIADIVIGNNNDDGIAIYLKNIFKTQRRKI